MWRGDHPDGIAGFCFKCVTRDVSVARWSLKTSISRIDLVIEDDADGSAINADIEKYMRDCPKVPTQGLR